MKAKEYIATYHQRIADGASEDDAIKGLMDSFIDETKHLFRQRANGRAAIPTTVYDGVLREMDMKWRSIACQMNWNVNGYQYLMTKLLHTKEATQ